MCIEAVEELWQPEEAMPTRHVLGLLCTGSKSTTNNLVDATCHERDDVLKCAVPPSGF